MTISMKDKNKIGLSTLRSMSFGETALFLLTLLLWIDRILLTYIRAVMLALPIVGGLADAIISAVYIVLVVFSVPQVLRRIRLSDLGLVFLIILVCVLNYVLFPANADMLDRYLPTFLFFTFPLYFIGLSLDFEKIYPWLYGLSLLTIPAFTAHKVLVSAPMTDAQSVYAGDMWAAYNLLPHVCVVAVAMFKKAGTINVVLTITGIIMIASMGSRGPLLCAVAAMAVYLLFFKKYRRPVLACFLIIVLAVTAVLGMDTIMHFLHDMAKGMGLSVRIFEKYFEGAISDSSGRDIIAGQLYERIGENPVVGYGLFADRVAIRSYAHNISVELWHSCGVIFGTAILGAVIVVLLRAAKVVKKVEQYALLFVPLLFAGFIKLFFSSSCLEDMYLFLLLGVSIRIARDKNEKVRNTGYENIKKAD